MSNIIGTSFATSGFTYDANLSPNNQSFAAAVLAILSRLSVYPPGTGGGGSGIQSIGGTDASTNSIFGFTNTPLVASGTLTMTLINQNAKAVLIGPTSGGAAQPAFRALVAGDIPALPYGTGTLIGISGTATGAGTGALQITGVPITGTGGTFTLVVNTFAGNNVGVVPSGPNAAGTYLSAQGNWVGLPGGTNTSTGSVTSVAGTDASAHAIYGFSGQPITTGGTFTMTLINQGTGSFLAGPSSGAAAQPTFRPIVAGDVPHFINFAFDQVFYSMAGGF